MSHDMYSSLTEHVVVENLAPSSLFSMAGRTALVTGAAGGLGTWVSASLLGAGATVAMSDLDTKSLDDARRRLGPRGAETTKHEADLSSESATRRVIDDCISAHGRIDALVNCAATNRRQAFVDVDVDSFDRVLALDLRMPFFLSQHAAREMTSAGGGTIVHITSTNARYGLESTSVYAAAKAGLEQLVRSMAVELASHNVRVNAIAPGFLMTPLSKPLWEDDAKRLWILERVPLARPGTPREFAAAVQLLCSEASSFITGQTIVIDGGFLAGGDWSVAR